MLGGGKVFGGGKKIGGGGQSVWGGAVPPLPPPGDAPELCINSLGNVIVNQLPEIDLDTGY